MHTHIYIYIYVYKERERDTCLYVCLSDLLEDAVDLVRPPDADGLHPLLAANRKYIVLCHIMSCRVVLFYSIV